MPNRAWFSVGCKIHPVVRVFVFVFFFFLVLSLLYFVVLYRVLSCMIPLFCVVPSSQEYVRTDEIEDTWKKRRGFLSWPLATCDGSCNSVTSLSSLLLFINTQIKLAKLLTIFFHTAHLLRPENDE